jgi:hypothetical protein
MSDQWRKNIPADYEGKDGENWDDDIKIKPIYQSAIGIVVSVAISFVLCWFLIIGLNGLKGEHKASPIAAANARRLPPSPMLQPIPEVELEQMRVQMAARLAGYGYSDELAGTVHIPIDKAMDLMLRRQPASAAVEPVPEKAADVVVQPVDHGAGH